MSKVHAGDCLAAVFRGPSQPMELRSFPIPQAAAGEAVVRVDLCTICGSDLHTVRGARVEPTPSILGHEILGTITGIGDPPPRDVEGQPLRCGDRVTWSVCVSCFACDRCRAGFPQKCSRLAKYGHAVAEGREALSGGLAEYVLLRSGSSVVKLDAGLPDVVACPANCATATVAAACRLAEPIAGKRVLVLGAGMLGITLSAFAKFRDASHVTVADIDLARAERSTRFNADKACSWESLLARQSNGISYDAIFECSGSPDAVELAIRLGDIGACIVLVGSVMESRAVQIDPQWIVRRWLSIRGVHNYAPEDLRQAVDFLRHSHANFPFADLVERTFPLTSINEAIEFSLQHRPIRVAVRP